MADRPHANVLIVCPLQFERTALLRAGIGSFARIDCSGPGGKAVTTWMASHPELQKVVLVGLAGGLCRDVSPGSSYWINQVVDAVTGQRYTPTEVFEPAESKAIASASESIVHPDAKRALHEQTGAQLVDLESSEFARAAEARGLQWAVLRGVSDDCTTALPSDVDNWVLGNGGVNFPAVAWSVFRHPSHLAAALQLRKAGMLAMKEAAESLLRFFQPRGLEF